MSNTGGDLPVGNIEYIPLGKLMDAYDALPPRIKELYDLMPINLNPIEMGEMVTMYGEPTAYRLMWDFINANFPGWNGGVRKRERRV